MGRRLTDNWRKQFKPHILERGLNYYEEGMVESLEETAEGYKAIVNGSEEYSVEIDIDEGNISYMFCDCPYADEGNCCKHMAAVLYEIEGGKTERKPAKDLFQRLADEREELKQVVNRIPEGELRLLVVGLAQGNESLRSRLLTQYTEKIDERHMIKLKCEVDRIAYENSDRSGFVDYYHASDYTSEMTSFLDEKVQALIDKGYYMKAFELTNYVFQCVGNQDMDDSDGGCTWVVDNCYEYWKQILDKCSEQEQKQMFQWFQEHQSGYVIDYVEEYISDFLMEEFKDEELLREKLRDLDEQIRKAGDHINDGRYCTAHYGYVSNVLKRIQVMKDLGSSEQEINEYRQAFRHFSEIRKLEIREYTESKKYAEAIRVLKESKKMDAEYPGLIDGYSRKLMEVYKLIGNNQEYRKELEYYIFSCSQSNLEHINMLKAMCKKGEWEDYRNRLLESKTLSNVRYLFLESEGLYDHLLEEIVSENYYYNLDRFENTLKKIYPERVRDAYIALVRKDAERVADRKRYKELVQYLKKISKYPDGKNLAKGVAAEWRALYYRRSAMMDELRKAGF